MKKNSGLEVQTHDHRDSMLATALPWQPKTKIFSSKYESFKGANVFSTLDIVNEGKKGNLKLHSSVFLFSHVSSILKYESMLRTVFRR